MRSRIRAVLRCTGVMRRRARSSFVPRNGSPSTVRMRGVSCVPRWFITQESTSGG